MTAPADLSAKIDLWRQKAAAGTLSLDECREALSILRAGRVAASQTSTTSRTKKASAAKSKQPIDSDALLDGF